MITAKEIKKDIRSAVKQFGEHNYFDKGLYESMDVYKYGKEFITVGAEATADILEAVLKLDKKYGEYFVQGMLLELDAVSGAFWDVLMERPELEKLY